MFMLLVSVWGDFDELKVVVIVWFVIFCFDVMVNVWVNRLKLKLLLELLLVKCILIVIDLFIKDCIDCLICNDWLLIMMVCVLFLVFIFVNFDVEIIFFNIRFVNNCFLFFMVLIVLIWVFIKCLIFLRMILIRVFGGVVVINWLDR